MVSFDLGLTWDVVLGTCARCLRRIVVLVRVLVLVINLCNRINATRRKQTPVELRLLEWAAAVRRGVAWARTWGGGGGVLWERVLFLVLGSAHGGTRAACSALEKSLL